MEKAVDELKYTWEQANEYLNSAVHYLEELQAHSEALNEDIEIVEKQQRLEKTPDRDAEDLVRLARRLRRNLDKLMFPLQRAAKAAEVQLQKERIEVEKQANSVALALQDKQLSSEKKVSGVKLPHLKIPTFKGDVEQWRGFKQIINDIIDADENMSTTKKWLLLRENLTGKALELVHELPAAPETFKVAMDILEQSYGSVNKAVTHLYHRLQNLPVSSMANESLRLTNAKIDGMLRSLETLGEDINSNRFLRTVIISKFPKEVFLLLRVNDDMDLAKFRKKIAGFVATNENTIEQLPEKATSSFSRDQSYRNRFRGKNPAERTSQATEVARKESTCNATEEGSVAKKLRPAKCTFCAAAHYSDQCTIYKTLEQRKQKLTDRCQVCLRAAHPNKSCARTIKCAHCEDTAHNRALCPKKFAETEKSCQIRDVPFSKPEKQEKIAKVTEEIINAGYVTMMIDIYPSPNAEHSENARAILDTASRRTLIKRSLVNRLAVKENREALVQVYGVTNMSSTKEPNGTCKIYLRPKEHRPILIEAVIMDDIIDDIVAPSVTEFRRRYHQFEQLPMPEEGNGRAIELLIGTRTLVPILTLHNSIPVSQSLQLLSTKFGWVILGGYEEEPEIEENSVSTMVIQAYDPVKLMCELDVIGLKGLENTQDEEEAIALQKFYETIEFLENQRYEMGLPYRYDPPDLSDNFGLAWGRLQSLYKKLVNSPELLQTYDGQIREQENLGIVEKIYEKIPKKINVHYIAHQVVLRVDKTTPVRIVVDASAHTAGKRSLNDNILKGANWVDDMPALIMRFRKNKIGVTADISKAFHQLSIRKQDRDVCRFLWLKDIEKPPSRENLQIYRFCRVAFGIASSPFLLYATIKYHLRKHPHEFTSVLENDFYADNLVTSLPESLNLAAFYSKVKETFSTMSMNLTKWASNSEELLKIIPSNDQNPEIHQTILGLGWRTDCDAMNINVKQNIFNVQTKITKRRILKEAATVFDPLGWAMPIVLTARIFIRQIWKQNFGWDDALPEELVTEWSKIRRNLIEINKIQLPRKMFFAPNDKEEDWELHVFSDASIQAYAVVVFIKSGNRLAFVASKARLTPKNKLSVPRLELVAVVVAARYSTYIRRSLKTKTDIKVTLWSDSKCVLSWLRTKKILPAYVHKTITEIKTHNISTFNYVPSEQNPADIASRGADYTTLNDMQWWQGPMWLQDENQWPAQDYKEEKLFENLALRVNSEEKTLLTKTNAALKKFDPKEYQSSPFNLDPKKFHSFEELLRRSAYILHAINQIFNSRIQKRPISVENAKTNFNFIRKIWLRWDQKRAYEEIAINRKSNAAYLRNISIFRDEDEILRCATRLQNSGKQHNTIYPVLLVKDSPLTQLIIMSSHINNLHAGTSHTLAALRRAYWLPQGRQQVYKTLKRICSTCRQHAAKPFALPEMAPLPEFRIQKTETPFRNTGIDTFGPIEVKIPDLQKQHRKRWVIIFTCMIIRAIHLEILDDMTTEEFLFAFRRFTARRGVPEIIVSDNAPQFCVMERKFVNLWQHISETEDVVNYFAKKQIQWKFIPPHSPWMGGVYERLIKSVKVAFEKTNPVPITPKQLVTVLTEIEAMMNSRPISYVDKNIETLIITPNHFLAVRYPSIPVDLEKDKPDEINKLWKAAEEILATYWKKWSEYYVLALRDRVDDMKNPAQVNFKQPKVGEVVVMPHPTKKRSLWTKAIVERLIPSQDGRIRSVQIRMPNRARLIRPINKLLCLELLTDLPDINRMELNAAKSGLVHQLPENVEDEAAVAECSSTNRARKEQQSVLETAAGKTAESVTSKQSLEKFLKS